MSEVPTRNEILAASSESGLLAYLFDVAATHSLYRESEFLATVAELIGSGERTLFAERDWAFLRGMNGRNFFLGMGLLCKLIPLLDVGHRDMMQFVATLVERGGKDGAARQPNIAFRTWCSGDPARVKAILDDARTGDNLAIEHLCFALEAGEAHTDALTFLSEGLEPKAQMSAATALGRMALDAGSAATAVHSLSEVSIMTHDADVRNNALLSSFAILERNAELPRRDARRALDRVLGDTSAKTLDALSALIWRHGKSLSEDEISLILNALKLVDPEDRGTLERIDFATLDLASAGHFDVLSNLVAELIRRSRGKLELNDFPSFRGELVVGDSRRLGRLVVNWFLEGNPYLCASLAKQFNAVGGQPLTLDIQIDDIPTGPEDQLFVCRKAVGFLFYTPVTAASVLVKILRHGDDRIAEKVCAILYNPLLISFGGGLRRYLEEIVEQNSEPSTSRIKEILTQKQRHIDGVNGIETLVELQPSESHRQIEHVRSSQQITQAMEESMKGSIIRHLATTQYLLYGETASFYMKGLDGETHQVNMEMRPYSASVEYPQLAIFDPEGLQTALQQFKYEQRINR